MSNTPLLSSVMIRPITKGPHHHFFGYYDKSPWDVEERRILGLETTFIDRPQKADDVATIGWSDSETGEWTPLAETHAWNWQQGCMLQWLGTSGKIIYNDRRNGHFVSCILDVNSGKEQILQHPVYAVNRQGTHAISLNFSRLQHQRPGYGYCGIEDPWKDVKEPVDDGVYVIDLQTGHSRMILSIAQVALMERTPDFNGKMHRFNHAQFAENGTRFAVLHRYKQKGDNVGQTRLFTMNIDGSDLKCLCDWGSFSHYDWRGSDSILAWAGHPKDEMHYYLFNDKSGESSIIGEHVFNCDGHCSFSPDKQWMLTDTYPDETRHRALMLYHWETGERMDIGRFYSPDVLDEIRCDLHPRWSRRGDKICIDSMHEGSRQMYVLDVSKIVQS